MRGWFSDIGATKATLIIFVALIILFFLALSVYTLPIGEIKYSEFVESDTSAAVGGLPIAIDEVVASTTEVIPAEPVFVVKHIKTPEPLKAVYITSWAAGNKKFRDHIYDLASSTEINAVVIDIKDYTGKIGFLVDDPELQKFESGENRIPDIKEYIGTLHDMGIYVIGRLSSFQDSHLINLHPEWAVKTPTGEVWKDYKGVKWLEVGAKPVWDYLIQIARYSHSIGFDEINFDYIRFPSDGNIKNIAYNWTDGRPRSEVLREFFMYIRQELSDLDAPISADLFGLTTSAYDDLGIGQVLEDALAYFDYVSPMVYPSHYGSGFNGIVKPATEPYKVVKLAMDEAVKKALKADISPHKLRPWLQDFDLGATYTPDMVRAQIQATYDAGLSSWMLWNAGVRYQKNALLGEDVVDVIAEIKPLPVPVVSTSTVTEMATSTATSTLENN